MRGGEQLDELGLGPVRVLELVDEDVSEAAPDLVPGGGRAAQETEGERDLVAEVDEPRRREELLVADERPGQLELAAGRLDGDRCGLRTVGRVALGKLGQQVRRRRLALGFGEVVGGSMSSSLSRLKWVASAPRKRFGSPSGR
jgi:hypothetical protein